MQDVVIVLGIALLGFFGMVWVETKFATLTMRVVALLATFSLTVYLVWRYLTS